MCHPDHHYRDPDHKILHHQSEDKVLNVNALNFMPFSEWVKVFMFGWNPLDNIYISIIINSTSAFCNIQKLCLLNIMKILRRSCQSNCEPWGHKILQKWSKQKNWYYGSRHFWNTLQGVKWGTTCILVFGKLRSSEPACPSRKLLAL